MTTKFTYTPEIKKQAKNPFAKMTPATKNRCQLELRKRLLWLSQLGSSRDTDDQAFYQAFVLETSREHFGRAPEYNNADNTGLAVLSGAVEKLYEGDLSMKQIRYITPVLDTMAQCYPKLWDTIVFESSVAVPTDATTPYETLFE